MGLIAQEEGEPVSQQDASSQSSRGEVVKTARSIEGKALEG